jgi:acyl-coenzyme A synthetase/AMP-(fatty) acid ligase
VSIELQRRVQRFLAGGVDDFDALALAVYRFQYERNPVYRAYCDRQPPVSGWREIPAVPTAAFKDFPMTCFPVAEAVAEFHTSGTTGAQTGKHYFKTLSLYAAAARISFAAHVLPDGAELPALCLTADPAAGPHSSLVRMLSWVAGPAAEYFVEGATLQTERLGRRLCEAQWDSEPVLVLGTAFALLHLVDHCAASGMKFALPAGSRIMETGGFKGRSRAVPRAELYRLATEWLGVPATHIVNEYGMTELSSQFYDESLRTGVATDRKRPPFWTRVRIMDPATGREAARGQPGLIRVYDLANVWSSMALQTEDLGVAHADGTFTVQGRAPGAAGRGCSLTAESLNTE